MDVIRLGLAIGEAYTMREAVKRFSMTREISPMEREACLSVAQRLDEALDEYYRGHDLVPEKD